MSAPPKVQPRGLADYLEVLTRAAFQSGPSWRVIDANWDGFREELAADRPIVRNRRKIEATADNARAMLELDAKHGGFQRYLRSHSDLLYVVGEPVPPHEEWAAARRRAK
jgi:3-methyladenine DNA glycosylase Tag